MNVHGNRSPGYEDGIVRSAVTAAIKASPFSREEIAERMSEMIGTRVTCRMLNDFTADSKTFHRFPAAWIGAFCKAVDDYSLLALIAREAGYGLLDQEDSKILKLGRSLLAQRQAAAQISKMQRELMEAAE